jgi:hypothetical protein
VTARGYKTTFHESTYRRAVGRRLTPLSWFLLSLAAIAVFAFAIVLTSRWVESRSASVPMPHFGPTEPAFRVTVFAQAVPPTPEPLPPTPTPEPTPVPTVDWSRAPWADRLERQPDGTLIAPPDIVARAVDDLSAYYTIQRDLSLDDYLAQRDHMLATYFTGAALQEMKQIEESRDLYTVNRAGRFSFEVRHFSTDGLTARMGIVTRDWVGDLYDVATRQLITSGRAKKDALTIMTIAYDPASGRWKFAAVEDVVELQ